MAASACDGGLFIVDLIDFCALGGEANACIANVTPLQEMTRVTNQQMPSQVAHMSPAATRKRVLLWKRESAQDLSFCSQSSNALEHVSDRLNSLAVPSVSLAVAGMSNLVASLRRVDSLKAFPGTFAVLATTP